MPNHVYLPIYRLPRISLCGYCQTEDGFIHPDRIMDVNVLLYVEKGEFRIFEENHTSPRSEIILPEGSLVFLKQGLHHYGETKCPKGTKWFFVHFHLDDFLPFHLNDSLSDNLFSPDTTPLSFLLYQEQKGNTPVKPQSLFYQLPKQLRLKSNSSILSKFSVLDQMFQSQDFENHMQMNVYLYQILLDIYNENLMHSHRSNKNDRIKEIMAYIESMNNLPFSSPMLEQQFGLSFKHLNVLFKNATGLTLQKYHAQIRMNKASKMLMETSMSIDEISDSLGFDSPYYFSNSFKKQFGIAPSRYRKENILI